MKNRLLIRKLLCLGIAANTLFFSKKSIFSTTNFINKNLIFIFLLLSTSSLFGQFPGNDNSPTGLFSRTFTVPANVTHVNAAAWGAGGGGGGSNTNNSGGSGGGGGGAVFNQIAVSNGNVFNYTIGSGGAGGGTVLLNGGDGGNSSITSTNPNTNFAAGGGMGGNGNRGAAGAGGTATGGTNYTGTAGIIGNNSGRNGGASGTAFTIFGAGGNGSTNANGVAGSSPGGGGGGGEKVKNGANHSGGAGADGRVMFDYISVSSVAPSPVCGGSTITITGTNFSTSGTTTVSVNGTACTSVTVVNSTTITAIVGIGSTSGVVDISNNGRRNNGKNITINPSPTITSQPSATSTCTTGTATFSVAATGATTYQWYRNGTALTNAAPYSGVNTATLTITNPATGIAGNFYVVVSNATCSISSDSKALSVFTIPPKVTTPVPANGSTATCYSDIGAVKNISWAASSDATSYDVYFGAGSVPSTITANVTTNSYNTGALAKNTTYYWRVVARNSCGVAVSSDTFSFTTSNAPCYCTPTTSTPGNTYIENVSFLGTLNDVSNNNTGYTNGYQDFTGLSNKTSQVSGEGINIYVESNGVDAIFKAWVDWNNDGSFNNTGPVTATSELVFTSDGIRAISTTFGIVIPAGTPPGDYRLRIRNYRFADSGQPTGYNGNDSYNSCEAFTGTKYGEAEDYIIKVLSNCSANIVAPINDVENCGPGALTLTANANSGTVSLRWYDAENGGTMLADTPVNASLSASFITPSISTTTTYYVTAWNGTCESIYRTPIVAKIKPLPNVSFDLPSGDASFCGENNFLKLNSSGSNELVELFNEKFDSGLGVFAVSKGSGDNSIVADTQWQNKTSTYKPEGSIWKPAISSGFGGNKFAFATSDYSTRTVNTILTTTSSYDTTDFINLNLSFSAYYSYYGDPSTGVQEGLFVEVSTDGTNWTAVHTYEEDLGIGTKFQTMTINLDSYKNIPNLKVRFRYLAYWGDGVAIDNIKLYGERPLKTSFTWSSTPTIGIFLDDCTTPYNNGDKISTGICIKPTETALETVSSWNVSAVAQLTNGCDATGTINIRNDNKVWNVTSSDWNTTNWKPNTAVPDISKCVIVKQPVILNAGLDGSAKNVTVQPGGSLQIMPAKTLTINDYLKNNSTADKVIVESDANLIQQNASVANVGSITAKRTVTGLRNNKGTAVDYVYWGSPVFGQQTKGAGGFSPGTPNAYFFSYRESNDRFYETGDANFVLGKGYAVQAVAGFSDFKFVGPPNNGNISYNLAFTNASHGYNLVANPYPSNITFEELYQGNSGLIYNTAWFWTNNIYEQYQKGSNYNGNNYSVINGTGGVSATYSTYTGSLTSNGTIKVGQGFIVQAKSGGSLNFKNDYGVGHVLRTGNTGTFFSKGAVQKNRFWLTLTNPEGVVNAQLIGYIEGATDAFEQDYDNEAFDDYSDLFYSDLAGKKMVIQGKSANFSIDDKIDLGANISQTGVYTIALDKADGIFNTSQPIYLKDKETGIVTNLSNQNYTFQATTGLSANRFEIIYKPEQTLSTGEVTGENIWVYREADNFVVKAAQKIKSLELYDASGRLILDLKPLSKESIIPADKLVKGVFVLKINLSKGQVITRKIRK